MLTVVKIVNASKGWYERGNVIKPQPARETPR